MINCALSRSDCLQAFRFSRFFPTRSITIITHCMYGRLCTYPQKSFEPPVFEKRNSGNKATSVFTQRCEINYERAEFLTPSIMYKRKSLALSWKNRIFLIARYLDTTGMECCSNHPQKLELLFYFIANPTMRNTKNFLTTFLEFQ